METSPEECLIVDVDMNFNEISFDQILNYPVLPLAQDLHPDTNDTNNKNLSQSSQKLLQSPLY